MEHIYNLCNRYIRSLVTINIVFQLFSGKESGDVSWLQMDRVNRWNQTKARYTKERSREIERGVHMVTTIYSKDTFLYYTDIHEPLLHDFIHCY